jgi:hypothetical protein
MAGGVLGQIIGGAITGGIGPAIGAALPSITDTAKILVERLVPDPAARAQAEKELAEALAADRAAILAAVAASDAAQNAVNLAEAQGNDRYSSRWRPTIGWIGALALGYQFLVAPVMGWFGGIVGVALGVAFPVPPMLPTGDLMPLIYALLGLSASRTVERMSGVSTAEPAGLHK